MAGVMARVRPPPVGLLCCFTCWVRTAGSARRQPVGFLKLAKITAMCAECVDGMDGEWVDLEEGMDAWIAQEVLDS